MGKDMERVKERDCRIDSNDSNNNAASEVQDELRKNGNLQSRKIQPNGTEKQEGYQLDEFEAD